MPTGQEKMETPGFAFEVLHRHGNARVGRLQTPHGEVETPAFVAVGTQASVKSLAPDDLEQVGTQIIFANTYHLYLRPGPEVVAELGGLHAFMQWHHPIMTDSGGFQVFSLGASIEQGVGKIASIFPDESPPSVPPRRKPTQGRSLVQVTDEGVWFRSHLDGSRHWFTPEIAVQVQRQLGADILLAFDECTSPLHDYEYTRQAMERTHRWALRSLEAFHASEPLHGFPQALYGIVQGGAYEELRRQSTRFIAQLPFDGFAIGGSLGRTKADMWHVLEWTVPHLPDHKPRHLLGIGEVADIFAAVARGVDTFDCVAPTRMARNAGLLARTLDGKPLPRFRINMRNARFRRDPRAPVEGCDCPTCRTYSRAYLHHLFRANELLAYRLATVHNLFFMNRLMAEIRAALQEGTFDVLKTHWLGS
ncbi:MAG: tRNA guanosine(34) transglycosylase Tgt [Ardenticatenia bacterium]|nr:tRNA guanosine(34) transglycosylase Tgt [Ardenticatenia bacterium]